MSAQDVISQVWGGWLDTNSAWREAYAKLDRDLTPMRVEAAVEDWINKTQRQPELAARPPTPAEVRAMVTGRCPDWVTRHYEHLTRWMSIETNRNIFSAGLNDWNRLSAEQKAVVDQQWSSIQASMSVVGGKTKELIDGMD